MQFVVFMDLLGTVVLPVAICLTYSLIVSMALQPPKTFDEAIPLMLLLAVIGLPGVLILITTRKVVYIFWMLIYLVALPVWNFVLPVYAFWHFDDFSWGETRKVEGERKSEGHDTSAGILKDKSVPMRRWEDWERSRLRKLKREEKRRHDMARAFPNAFPKPEFLRTNILSQYSDTLSMASSSDDDQWGAQIGTYNENSAQYPPPPPGIHLSHEEVVNNAETFDSDAMAAMLESGFDERPSSLSPSPVNFPGQMMNGPRYQLSDGPTAPRFQAYPPVARHDTPPRAPPPRHIASPISPTLPVNASSSAVDWKTHAKKRSAGNSAPNRYGPLGPLDPGDSI